MICEEKCELTFLKIQLTVFSMNKTYLLIIVLLFSSLVKAQDLSEEIKALHLEEMDVPSSVVSINIGAGNGVFSKENNARNANQQSLDKIFYTANVTYDHKSGAGISLTPYFLQDAGNFTLYQFAVNPYYSYISDKFTAGASYTRFVKGAAIKINASPYQNEYGISFKWVKAPIRPFIQMQYADGKRTTTFDTIIKLPLGGLRKITDTTNTKTSDFTISIGADHKFGFGNIFSQHDDISLVTGLSFNAGSGKSIITNTYKRSGVNNTAIQKTRRRSGSSTQPFAAQSFALSNDIYYSFNKFFIEPQLYVDYYIAPTDSKRLTAVYAINIGINF